MNKYSSRLLIVLVVIILIGLGGYIFFVINSGNTRLETPVTDATLSGPNETTENDGETMEEARRSIPGPPQKVSATRIGPNKISITWEPYGPAAKFNIYRYSPTKYLEPTVSTPMEYIGTSDKDSHEFIDRDAGGYSWYAVTEFNQWNNESRKSLSNFVDAYEY